MKDRIKFIELESGANVAWFDLGDEMGLSVEFDAESSYVHFNDTDGSGGHRELDFLSINWNTAVCEIGKIGVAFVEDCFRSPKYFKEEKKHMEQLLREDLESSDLSNYDKSITG